MTKKEYYEFGVLVSVVVAYFWVNSTGCSDEFHVFFKHFENLKNLILKILKEELHIPWLVGSFFWKPWKAFRIAQYKQPRLVKPCLNYDPCFISKTSGTAFLQTPSQFLPWKQKNPFPSTSRYINNITALICIFSSILNCS